MTNTGSVPADSRATDEAAGKQAPLPSHDGNAGGTVNMAEYRDTFPLWERVWRHSFTQMMLLSMQAFCGPAMSDAIAGRLQLSLACLRDPDRTGIATDNSTGLGGGGLATPQTSNIA